MSGLVFLSPFVLGGLLALPLLWWLLRATPPAPLRVRFPGTRLLQGLQDRQQEASKTPWWLMALRLLAAACAIIAFAQPVLAPDGRMTQADGPLLLIMDGGWASAPDWDVRVERALSELDQANRQGREVAFVNLTEDWTPETVLNFQTSEFWRDTVAAAQPRPLPPARARFANAILQTDMAFETIWISDGLAPDEGLADAFLAHGPLRVLLGRGAFLALSDPKISGDGVSVNVLRPSGKAVLNYSANVFARSADGAEVAVARADGTLEVGEKQGLLEVSLPPNLRNRITRITLQGQFHAGATALLDDRTRVRSVGIVKAVSDGARPNLVAPDYYLKQALAGTAQISEGSLAQLLVADVAVIILAEAQPIPDAQVAPLLTWVQNGGTLLRFAGAGLTGDLDTVLLDDPLLPVQLRTGGRNLGGAMSWTEPQSLADFPAASPFNGLTIPPDVTVSAQVIAQPSPDLSDRSYASLRDGTPLVTGRAEGAGRLILFHVMANAEWSNLPLSGLFVQMLERLAVASAPAEQFDLRGQAWVPQQFLDVQGYLYVPDAPEAVDGAVLADGVGAEALPGLYAANGTDFALNLLSAEAILQPMEWPASASVTYLETADAIPLDRWFLLAALALLLMDIPASAFASGRWQNRKYAGLAGLLFFAFMPTPDPAAAQQMEALAANETVLGYVRTGVAAVDQKSEDGLFGLSLVLNLRTSVEPVKPVGLDLERDEIAFFPFLYWPVTADQPDLSDAAAAKVNAFMRTGGVILFDTQDAELRLRSGPNADLRRLTAKLELPALAPVPENHVLTRAFYLLSDFPGRYDSGQLWVKAGQEESSLPGQALRNDGVSPVLVGSNDYAAAWATDDMGLELFPVGQGLAGERQREMAQRFGVNLIMYVLTGNYKSDQVHIPALLERLGE